MGAEDTDHHHQHQSVSILFLADRALHAWLVTWMEKNRSLLATVETFNEPELYRDPNSHSRSQVGMHMKTHKYTKIMQCYSLIYSGER